MSAILAESTAYAIVRGTRNGAPTHMILLAIGNHCFMIRPLWYAVLVGLMALGLWTLVQDRRELGDLRRESDRLGAIVGEIDTEDPSRIHIVNVADKGPNELLWRVFLPAGHSWTTTRHMASGGRSSHHQSSSSSSADMLVRYCLRENEKGWSTFLVHGSGSSSSSVQQEIGEFIDEHWKDLHVQIAASESQLDVATDEVVTLLSIEVPQELMELAEERLKPYVVTRLKEAPVMKIEIGSEEAFAIREKQEEETLGEVPK